MQLREALSAAQQHAPLAVCRALPEDAARAAAFAAMTVLVNTSSADGSGSCARLGLGDRDRLESIAGATRTSTADRSLCNASTPHKNSRHQTTYYIVSVPSLPGSR